MPFKPTDYLPYDFANRRHIGPSGEEIDEMLALLEVKNLDELIDETVPENIRQLDKLKWERAKSEREVLYHLRQTASKNKVLISSKENPSSLINPPTLSIIPTIFAPS